MRQRVFAAGLLLMIAAAPARGDTPIFNWSGFYVGGHAGYGWGQGGQGNIGFVTDGGLAGGQVGVNRQIGNFVFGLEGEVSWSGLRGNLAISNYFGQAELAYGSQLDWLATAAGRVGIAQGSSLIYVKGGACNSMRDWSILDLLRRRSTSRIIAARQPISDGPWAAASNMPLRRTGRHVSNTPTSTFRTAMSRSQDPSPWVAPS